MNGRNLVLQDVIRRLFKCLPVSIEALQVANVDAKREAGEKIDPNDVVDINAISVDDFKDIQDAEVITAKNLRLRRGHCMNKFSNKTIEQLAEQSTKSENAA